MDFCKKIRYLENRSLSNESFIHPLIYIYMYSFNKYLLNIHSARTRDINGPFANSSLSSEGIQCSEMESHMILSTFDSYKIEIIFICYQARNTFK